MTEITPAEKAGGPAATSLESLRFDYAWKWFAYHAEQRTKMFNWLLLAMGVFASAVATSYGAGEPIMALALCISAAIISLAFTRLDRRNQDLVWMGETVLNELERETIFATDKHVPGPRGRSVLFGILTSQGKLDEEQGYVGISRLLDDAWKGKHRIWLRFVGYLGFVMFSLLGLLIASTIDWSKPHGGTKQDKSAPNTVTIIGCNSCARLAGEG